MTKKRRKDPMVPHVWEEKELGKKAVITMQHQAVARLMDEPAVTSDDSTIGGGKLEPSTATCEDAKDKWPEGIVNIVKEFQQYRYKRRFADTVKAVASRYQRPVTAEKGRMSFAKKIQMQRRRLVCRFRPEDDVQVYNLVKGLKFSSPFVQNGDIFSSNSILVDDLSKFSDIQSHEGILKSC